MDGTKDDHWELADCVLLGLIWIFLGAEAALTIYIGATVGFWLGEVWNRRA